MEFSLKVAIVVACFKVFGSEFQCFGAIYLIDLWSEVLTARFLWDPLVLGEWFILLVRDVILINW